MAEKVFTKNFLLMFLSNLLICIGFYMLMPVLPVYAVQQLNISNDDVGIIIGVFAFSAVITRAFSGILVDNYGRMVVYIPSLIIFALCFGGYAFTTGIFSLIIVRILNGLSWSGVSTANSAIVADIVPASMRGQGMGYFGLSMTVAMALGPAIGVYLINKISYFNIFIFCSLISLMALFATIFVKPPKIDMKKTKFSVKNLFEKQVLGVSIIQFFYGFASSAVMTFAVLHGIERNISGVGYYFLIFAIFVSIVRSFGGKILDKKGPALFMYSGHIIYIIGCLLLAFSENTLTFLLSSVFTGFGAGLLMPTLMTMMVNLVMPNRRGAASATVLTAMDAGVGFGAIVMGYIAHIAGYSGMYIFAAAIFVIPLLWFIFYENKHYNKIRNVIKMKTDNL